MQTRYATIVALRRLAAPPRLEAIRRLAAMEGDGQPAAVAIISVAEAAARIDGTAVGVAPVEL
jgi:hypothetical protein